MSSPTRSWTSCCTNRPSNRTPKIPKSPIKINTRYSQSPSNKNSFPFTLRKRKIDADNIPHTELPFFFYLIPGEESEGCYHASRTSFAHQSLKKIVNKQTRIFAIKPNRSHHYRTKCHSLIINGRRCHYQNKSGRKKRKLENAAKSIANFRSTWLINPRDPREVCFHFAAYPSKQNTHSLSKTRIFLLSFFINFFFLALAFPLPGLSAQTIFPKKNSS